MVVVESSGTFSMENNEFIGNYTTNKITRQEYIDATAHDYTHGGFQFASAGLVVTSKSNTFTRYSFIERGAVVYITGASFTDDSSTFSNN